jgi:hypothetical protein
MTEFGQERERRRRQRSLRWVGYLVCVVSSLSFRVGPVPALLGVAGMAVVTFSLLPLFSWRGRRAERRRRASGAQPSWAAQLPLEAARQCGATVPGRHARESDMGELFGRLTYLGDGLRWDPREADRSRGVGPITWDRSWSAEVVPIWGPGRQGCLTLVGADGTAIDLWIRDPKDLSRTLELAESR